jgi:mRNA interferase YafQ
MRNYEIAYSSKFKKDYKKLLKKKKELEAINRTIALLSENGHQAIPQNMKPHKLVGNYSGVWECHVLPDLLLIWDQTENPKEIYLMRIGSHSELF